MTNVGEGGGVVHKTAKRSAMERGAWDSKGTTTNPMGKEETRV